MLKRKTSLLPNSPGCYLFKDKNGFVIYVGKAKNLKSRVSSYFQGKHDGKTKILIDNTVDFEHIITQNETEALILELNLIKQYNPKYNILLRDDKSYPYIELTNEKYPRLFIVRKRLNKKITSKIFGPYPNAYAAKKTVNMLNRMYPLRKCKTFNKKACLYYHINECAGYCINSIDQKEIDTIKNEIIKFLRGNDDILIKKIKDIMNEASLKLNFEKAHEMKLLLDDIEKTLNNQRIDLNDYIDRDVFGYHIEKGYISIQVFYIRGGKLVKRESNVYSIIDDGVDELTYYICSFYDKNNLKPKEILVPSIIDANLIENVLKINVLIPKKGKKKQILEMACKNAKESLSEKIDMLKKDEAQNIKVSQDLSNLLGLKSISRIEIFDNSHLFGTFSVSGMIVFIDGKANKNEYRKYKITSDYGDDYNLMKEVIYRRYFRVLKDGLKRPDLIIVDGGKIQVNAALEVLRNLGLDIAVCGLKKDDKHTTKELLYNNQIINIDKSSDIFHLFERMQDEVHRFTINYHKNIRSKGALESILDNVDGIGKVRKMTLLKKFGSLKKIKEASIDELAKILPQKIAIALKIYLKEKEREN